MITMKKETLKSTLYVGLFAVVGFGSVMLSDLQRNYSAINQTSNRTIWAKKTDGSYRLKLPKKDIEARLDVKKDKNKEINVSFHDKDKLKYAAFALYKKNNETKRMERQNIGYIYKPTSDFKESCGFNIELESGKYGIVCFGQDINGNEYKKEKSFEL
jgi:hypothetical protein